MDFEKHYCSEDYPRLNVEIGIMHRSALNAIECALKGNVDVAEVSVKQMLDALGEIRLLNKKKQYRDQTELKAVQARRQWF